MDPVNVLAKLEIRSFFRFRDNRGYTKNLGSSWIRPRSTFSKIFNGLLFGWTMWMYLPNLKSLALPVPEIIGGTLKIWAVPRSVFSKNFIGLLFGCTLWMHWPNLKSVAMPVPDMIIASAGLTMWQMWQMPRASGLRGASGSREIFQPVSSQVIRNYFCNKKKQESRSIVKTTARCAPCMGALKMFGAPWMRTWLLFLKFFMRFCAHRAYKCACTKFEVCSFSHSWDNRGYSKNGQSLDTSTLSFL